MQRYALPKQLDTVEASDRIIAVGMFDGLHIGHRAVLSGALIDTDLSPAVFTFSYTDRPKTGEALQTAENRQKILENLGFSALFEAEFSAFCDLSPAQFVDLLQTKLYAKAIVCGFNFRFGKNGAGNPAVLQQLCDERGIRLIVQPPVFVSDPPVSSTRIKEALTDGDMQTVTRLLAHPFTVEAPVFSGQQLGRMLGAPTINQLLPPKTVMPRFGVYASISIVNGRAYPSVTNVGVRPTVGSPEPLAETYILGVNEDLYDQVIRVQLIRFVRPEQKFQSVDQLKAQIKQDIDKVQSLFSPEPGKIKAIIFDFDNTLQDRQVAFYGFAHDWVCRHFPDLPEEQLKDVSEKLLISSFYGLSNTQPDVFETACQVLPWEQAGKAPSFDDLAEFWKTSYPAHTTLLPDAAAVLTALREKGYRLSILTNGHPQSQNRKVDVSGLRALVDDVVISGEERIQKPNPEIFRRAAFRLGVAPENCVFVGDNPRNDIVGAKNAGMTPIFYDWEYPEVTVTDPTVRHIHSLTELLSIY